MKETKQEPLEIELDVFEGPLDLLLHLINQFEIDIYDIPIAKITDQYLKYLEKMKSDQIDLASEYFVMAASLMEIKSEMLVPRNESPNEVSGENDEDDPREPLIELLLEYKKIKEVVPKFERRQIGRANFFGREPADLSNYREKIELENQDLEISDLSEIFYKVLKRYELNKPKKRTIDPVEVTVPEKMEDIMDRLLNSSEENLSFFKLLDYRNRSEIVLSFLAVLELIKSDQIFASQTSLSADIAIALKNENTEVNS